MQPTTLAVPPLKRVPPGAWTALVWCAGAAFTFLVRLRLPGEEQPAETTGVLFYRWDGLADLALATILVLWGAYLLGRRPLLATVLVLAAMPIATLPLSTNAIPLEQFLAADVALYFVAAREPRETGVRSLVLAVGTVVAHMAVRLLCGWGVGTSAALAVVLVTVIAWLLGDAAHQARLGTERLTRTAAQRAVTEERLRIAREMHDQVAHSIGIVALQAGAARRVIDVRPEEARAALGEIERAGRETLAGLRRMLGALRTAERADTADGAGSTETGGSAPAFGGPPAFGDAPAYGGAPAHGAEGPEGARGPGESAGSDRPGQERQAAAGGPVDPAAPGLGLADLGRLVAVAGAAGVEVRLREGAPDRNATLPPDLGTAVYRIVQEAVTNVVKHSGADTCEVRVDVGADEVAVEVTDAGRGPGASPGTGFGLLGLRERVALLNGRFTAQPRAVGGFRVAAVLPLPAGDGPSAREAR